MIEPRSVTGTLQIISRTGGLRLKEIDAWYNPATKEASNQVQEDYKGRRVEIFLKNGSNDYMSIVCMEQSIEIGPATSHAVSIVPEKSQPNSSAGIQIATEEKNLKSEIPAEYIKNLQGKEFITHQGLLWMAHKMGLKEIRTELVGLDQAIVFKAAVVMKDGAFFQAYGDASDENVNGQIRQHKIRMAETRAVNRALRLATNLGMTSLEELGGEQ